MIYLKNGCARSEVKVLPANWHTQKASLKRKWKIYYRYYDPAFKGSPQWGVMIQIRGMNEFKDLPQRQAATKVLLESEKEKVDNRGYNPITGNYYIETNDVQEIMPDTPFMSALAEAKKLLKAGPECVKDIGYAINAMQAAAGKLFDSTFQKPYTALKIKNITPRHLVYMMAQCRKNNPGMTAYRANRFRSYLIMLFKELKRIQAVESNPALELEIDHTWVKSKRKILTDAEALIIDTNLKAWDYYYWRYMRIFYRSGSRSTEMLGLRADKVDLDLQEFTVLVKKGKQYKEDIRAIPDDALKFWQEVIQEAGHGQYLFSVGFKPGDRKIGKDNVCNRWRKYVKDDPPKESTTPTKDKRKLPKRKYVPLGIKVDFYALKHKNLDKIAEQSGVDNAKAAAGHTSVNTTKGYTVGEDSRQREKLKRTKVDF